MQIILILLQKIRVSLFLRFNMRVMEVTVFWSDENQAYRRPSTFMGRIEEVIS